MNNLTKSLIFATVFLIPSYLIKFSILNISTNILEIMVCLTFFSWIFENPTIDARKLFQKYKIYILPLSLIFLGLVVSTLFNQNYRSGFGIIKGWFLIPLLFSFVSIHRIKSLEDIENLLKAYYLSAFAVSFIAIQYFFLEILTYDDRLKSFYLSPNYLAMFLAPALFISWHFLSESWNIKAVRNKILLLFSLIIILVVFYFTYSYSAWISVFLGFLIIEIIKRKSRFNIKLTLIFVLMITTIFLTQLNKTKLENVFSERSSLNSRITIWKSSFKMLADAPISGIGPGNFQEKYLEYQKYFPPYLEWAVPEPHNLYLAFWLQAGIIGFAGFTALIFYWLKRNIKDILIKNKNSSLSAVFLGIMFYVLIHGLADTTFWKNDLSLIFWIIFSLKENYKFIP